MDRAGELVAQRRVDPALSLHPTLALEGVGHNQKVEVAFAAGAPVQPPFVVMTGVPPAVVFDLETDRRQGPRQFLADNRRDGAFGHRQVLVAVQIDPTLRAMSSAFQYKPRFKDMRVKPPKPEEEAAEADVLHLKPGEKPCQ